MSYRNMLAKYMNDICSMDKISLYSAVFFALSYFTW